MQPGQQLLVARTVQHQPGEAGAVVVVDGQDSVPHFDPGQGAGKDSQIASLGVAAQPEGARKERGKPLHIVQGRLLGGDSVQEAHAEVLLPAH